MDLEFLYKRGEVIQVSPLNVAFDEENNGRAFLYRLEDLQDLLIDLRSGRGIIAPIWCSLTDGGLRLVAGTRRLLAALEYLKEGNPKYLIKVLLVSPKDDLDALEMNARENAGRKNLSIIDQGYIAKSLREEPTRTGGRTLDQIARILNVSPAQVNQSIKLVTELPMHVQRAIHEGKVTADDALVTLKVPDPEKRAELVESLDKPEPEYKTITVSEWPEGGTKLIEAFEEKIAQVVDDEEAKNAVPFSSPDPPPDPEPPTPRQAARAAGAKVSLRMPELKKYLQVAIEEDGPGSNKGEITLKKALLDFIAGKFGEKKMDSVFYDNCKFGGKR